MLQQTLSQKEALEIMGKENFFGREDWYNFLQQSLSAISQDKIPLSSEFLNSPCPLYLDKKISETHFLFYGLTHLSGGNHKKNTPLTVMYWRKILASHDCFMLNLEDKHLSYEDEIFAKEDILSGVGWHLMLKTPWIPDYKSKRYKFVDESMQYLKGIGYRLPTVIEEITKLALYNIKNERQDILNQFGLCRNRTVKNSPVAVNKSGIFTLDDVRYLNKDSPVGLAASYKSQIF